MRPAKLVIAFMFVFALLTAGCIRFSYQGQQAKNNITSPPVYSTPPEPPKDCNDSTRHGACSRFKPYVCNNGELEYDALKCGCYSYQILENGTCRNGNSCDDGTLHNTCSKNQPMFCFDGNLLENASSCGCPAHHIIEGDSCRETSDCLEDGTKDGECSESKPFYCFNGTLVERAMTCGCFEGYQRVADKCINPYPPGTFKTYSWAYKGVHYSATLGFNLTLLDYYADQPRTYTCYNSACQQNWEVQYYKKYVFDPKQAIIINDLIGQVDGNEDLKLMALMAFVQSIPYDYNSSFSLNDIQKYPYDTLFYYLGVCSDKSLLGAAIAAKLGYGVALFSYDAENHMALGIKCPQDISNYNSGYCFLEMTAKCNRLTDNEGSYTGGITLQSDPKVLVMAEGKELKRATVLSDISEKEKYKNAKKRIQELQHLMAEAPNVNLYNSYVDEYNDNVAIYNSYNQCE